MSTRIIVTLHVTRTINRIIACPSDLRRVLHFMTIIYLDSFKYHNKKSIYLY